MSYNRALDHQAAAGMSFPRKTSPWWFHWVIAGRHGISGQLTMCIQKAGLAVGLPICFSDDFD